MSRTSSVPNAWDDDDWVSQADKADETLEKLAPQPNMSRQQRMQQHVEANRKLWESADTPDAFHYLEANSGGVPLHATSFKPQVKVLSRKPFIAKRDPLTGMSKLSLDDGNDEDDDVKGQGSQLTPEEIRAKQKKEREEKQRRYDEARAKIFGESGPASRGSSPGNGAVTPPRSDSRGLPAGRGRGRGSGYRNANNGNNNNNNNNSMANVNNGSSGSNNNVSGTRQFDRRQTNSPASVRELYDPNSSPRPESASRARGGSGCLEHSPGGRISRDDQQQPQQHPAIRSPRGPDGSGRGGFGFSRGGVKDT